MKVNYIVCALIFLFIPFCLKSQEEVKRFKYQGEVDLAYSYGIDDETNNINLEILNGIRFSRYFYAGIGLGASANFSDEAIFFPIYVNVKGYMPVSNAIDITAGLNVGTKLDYTYDMSGGLLFRPEFGLNFPIRNNMGLNLTLFYELYSYTTTVLDMKIGDNINQIGLKFGFSF